MSTEIVYSKTAFIMVEPPSRVISTHRINDRKEHDDLIAKAKQKGLYLYRADVQCKDGKYFAAQPWLIEWNTVTQKPIKEKPIEKVDEPPHQLTEKFEAPPAVNEFICKYCSKSMSSQSGLTLHIKSKHSDKFDKLEQSSEDDVVDVVNELQASDELQCPFCGKKASSTPGRTLHVKSRHPERYEEYLRSVRG